MPCGSTGTAWGMEPWELLTVCVRHTHLAIRGLEARETEGALLVPSKFTDPLV